MNDVLLVILIFVFFVAWFFERDKVRRLRCPVFVVFLEKIPVGDRDVRVQQVLQFSGKYYEESLEAARDHLTRAGFYQDGSFCSAYRCSNNSIWAEIVFDKCIDSEHLP